MILRVLLWFLGLVALITVNVILNIPIWGCLIDGFAYGFFMVPFVHPRS